MVDEAHISLPGTQPGWNKLLFEGNQVITKKSGFGCCISILFKMEYSQHTDYLGPKFTVSTFLDILSIVKVSVKS